LSDQMNHIGVITSSFGQFVQDFCTALAETGRVVTIVTQDPRSFAGKPPPGITIHRVFWAGGDRALGYMNPYNPRDALLMISLFRNASRLLGRLVEAHPFDHVLALWAVPGGCLAWALKRKHRIPFTSWCLGSDIWTYGKIPVLKHVVRRVLKASDLVFADGLKLAEDVEALSGRSCPFMPTCRRLDRALSRPPAVDGEGMQFLFVGRYARVKGVDLLLEAMSKYRRLGHRGTLNMFGWGPEEDFIRKRASRPDLRDCVQVHGYADEATFVSYATACDCLLIPSRIESIPVVFSDALQMKKPVIATEVGDMGLLMKQSPVGILIPPGDMEALCRAMCEMSESDVSQFVSNIEILSGTFDVKKTASNWLKKVEAGARSPGA